MDDSKFLADILAVFFQLDGYSARAAYSGEEAIKAANDDVPDIAFVDIDMPGLDGLEVARLLRVSPRTQGTLLVALSAWEEDPFKKEAFKVGFSHYLTKPIDAVAIREFMSSLEKSDNTADNR
ncbi:MAG: response regulator [Luteolibacter sp.]